MRVARLLVPLTVLALLTGCAGDADDADEPEPAPVAGSAEPRRIKVRSADAELAACIQGTWEVTPESLEKAMAAGLGDAFGATVNVTGGVTMSIGTATVTTRYDNYTEVVTAPDAAGLLAVTTRADGETVTDYSLHGDAMSTDGADFSSVRVDSSASIDGVAFDVPGIADLAQVSADASAATGSARQVTCSDHTLVLAPMIAGTTMPGLALTATRRQPSP